MEEEKRTIQQNKALHKWFELLAEALNDSGLDMKKTLKHDIDIPWTKDMIKKHLWKPVQKAVLNKESTTKLLKVEEIDKVFDVINRQLGTKFNIYQEFPSLDRIMEEEEKKLKQFYRNE